MSHENMEGKIDRPEEYAGHVTKCVTNREKNADVACGVFPARTEALDSQRSADLCTTIMKLSGMKSRIYKLKNISPHLQRLKAFKPFANCFSLYS
ncbi:hypothetical protein MJ575_11480 [Klebsiella pneumoniae]|nr:hypothetical protein MJ575_11480 [Klebsiella pneumoniae]